MRMNGGECIVWYEDLCWADADVDAAVLARG